MSGWVPAYAKLFDPEHEMADEPACKRWAWLDLCFLTQRKPATRMIDYKPVKVERGQLIASERFLAERWGWSRGKVRRFLTYLEDPAVKRLVAVQRTRKGTIYALPTYEQYALGGPPTGPLTDQPNGSDSNDIPTEHNGNRPTDGTTGGTSAGPLTVPNNICTRGKEVEVSVSNETSPSATAAAVGFFFEQVGVSWALNETIKEWAERIDREPKYAAVDIPYEIRRAAEWHVSKNKKPKSPANSIHNWLRRAATDAKPKKRGPADLGIRPPIWD